mmetsp:Transcript_31236/g.51575  ORF Transcript_31236/g.51575 Transcript_31236/m.51575 type:complete len:282 (-) Transcript_31236:514-1359(-)|eukprot:CAMPEP_0119012214 /NCGR_PEP_ID=MMETSP1176-20130426/6153_1 /TAXON_ID=265551 /ORGANISM="Synedropsis recta cf, Strain CCMP1620" /LENGTH=281 /DNA_ID=CAMNT_0006965135 /DNA_START=144 /DNA_END=989 /DNA_ORIENTATION=-
MSRRQLFPEEKEAQQKENSINRHHPMTTRLEALHMRRAALLESLSLTNQQDHENSHATPLKAEKELRLNGYPLLPLTEKKAEKGLLQNGYPLSLKEKQMERDLKQNHCSISVEEKKGFPLSRLDELRIKVAARVNLSSTNQQQQTPKNRIQSQPSAATLLSAVSSDIIDSRSSSSCTFCNKKVSDVQDRYAHRNDCDIGFECATCGDGVYCDECCYEKEGNFCAGTCCGKFFCIACCPSFIYYDGEGGDQYCQPSCCAYPFIRKELEEQVKKYGNRCRPSY